MPAGTSGENVCATSVFCGSYTITYLTPLMAANWSTVACTVDAVAGQQQVDARAGQALGDGGALGGELVRQVV